jgi:hypothetical protein
MKTPMQLVNRKYKIVNGSWLPDMDLNHDKVIQSHLCYRYTIGQTGLKRLNALPVQSSQRAISLTPGFSRVSSIRVMKNRFNGFSAGQSRPHAGKPLKRLCLEPSPYTGLKPGANERLMSGVSCAADHVSRFTFHAR